MIDKTRECLRCWLINCRQLFVSHAVMAGDMCDNSSVWRSLESFLLLRWQRQSNILITEASQQAATNSQMILGRRKTFSSYDDNLLIHRTFTITGWSCIIPQTLQWSMVQLSARAGVFSIGPKRPSTRGSDVTTTLFTFSKMDVEQNLRIKYLQWVVMTILGSKQKMTTTLTPDFYDFQ